MINTLGLEFCDEGFLAASRVAGQERLIPLEDDGPSSPGFVYFKGNRYITGREAEGQSRIHPRNVTDTCWDLLSLRSSSIAEGDKIPLYSELAFHHLKHLWQRLNSSGLPAEKVIFALPGQYLADDSEEELEIGLILSMVHDLQIPLAGIVDMACASLIPQLHAMRDLPFTALHLDIHQHAVLVSIIKVGAVIERQHLLHSSDIGNNQIINELMPKLANRFLSQTAFDVTHDANTEQAFYNQIRRLIDALRTAPECALELGGLKRPRQMVVTRDSLARHLDTVNDSILQFVKKAVSTAGLGPMKLYLTERVSRVPGLSEKLGSGTECQLIHLDIASAAFGATAYAGDIPLVDDLDHTPVITRIPVDQPAFNTPPLEIKEDSIAGDETTNDSSSDEISLRPTHIVYEGIAYPLGNDHFEIGTDIPDKQNGLRLSSSNQGIEKHHCRIYNEKKGIKIETDNRETTYLNHELISNERYLTVGDAISLGNKDPKIDLLLIHCNT